MSANRAPRPVCEIDRAYRELIGRPRSESTGTSNPCSPEPPEVRDYPASLLQGRNYFLCNGHLRDLFDELGRTPAPTVRA